MPTNADLMRRLSADPPALLEYMYPHTDCIIPAGGVDLFDRICDDATRAQLWETMRRETSVIWLVTADNELRHANSFLPADWGSGYPNVWLGVRAANNKQVARRVSRLLTVPAAKHFLVADPHEYINLISAKNSEDIGGHKYVDLRKGLAYSGGPEQKFSDGLGWVIVRGTDEPVHPQWLSSLREQCQEARVPFLFDSWGDWAPRDVWAPADNARIRFTDRGHDGHDLAAKGDYQTWLQFVGRRNSGCVLYRKTYREYPQCVSNDSVR